MQSIISTVFFTLFGQISVVQDNILQEIHQPGHSLYSRRISQKGIRLFIRLTKP